MFNQTAKFSFRKYLTTLFLLILTCAGYSQARHVRILLPANPTALNRKAAEVLGKQIMARSAGKVVDDSLADITIQLMRSNLGSPESFTISGTGKKLVTITGSDDAGIYYGVGKFLRTA